VSDSRTLLFYFFCKKNNILRSRLVVKDELFSKNHFVLWETQTSRVYISIGRLQINSELE
jgi:hypothetical protein